jgi:asparagine synthase (glutamine-hydrolysing)
MCGIAGAVRETSDGGQGTSRARHEKIVGVVERISAAQRHRGPDGSGQWVSSGREVVFAHRRLAILDLSDAGAQPMVEGESGCVITFNGEIYNFREIRRDLRPCERFRSSRHGGHPQGLRALGESTPCDAAGSSLLLGPARACHPPRARPDGHQAAVLTAIRDRDSGESRAVRPSARPPPAAVPRRFEPAAVAKPLHGFVVGPDTIVEGVISFLPPPS